MSGEMRIDCGDVCAIEENVDPGAELHLRLRAVPDLDSEFVKWDYTSPGESFPADAHSDTNAEQDVILWQDDYEHGVVDTTSHVYQATFRTDHLLSVQAEGGGVVLSAPDGIACGGICSAPFERGSRVTLTASPFADQGWSFGSWLGDCASKPGQPEVSEVEMTRDRNCTALFYPAVCLPPFDPPSWQMCVAGCANTDVDPANCGACEAACPLGTPCVGGRCERRVSLAGSWTLSSDTNPSPIPVVMIQGVSESSVTVSSVGVDGSQCDCNAQRLVVSLGATLPCDRTTLAFDYTTTAAPNSFGYTNTSSVWIRFLSGDNSVGYFLGSEQSGHSNCAFPWANEFPAPQLREGRNVIPLGALAAGTSGHCDSSFDALDIHMQGYGCFETDTSQSTLSNMVIY